MAYASIIPSGCRADGACALQHAPPAIESSAAAPWRAQEVRDVLAAIPYSDSDIYLHSDPSLMPKSRKTWWVGGRAAGCGVLKVFCG